MKAVVVRAPMDFAVEEIAPPQRRRAGYFLTSRRALCGSDLRTLRSGHRKVTLPWTIGHEICGEVKRGRPGYAGPWQAGDLISVGPLAYCGRCDFCREGRYELCESYREIAQAWPGGFAEQIAIPRPPSRWVLSSRWRRASILPPRPSLNRFRPA